MNKVAKWRLFLLLVFLLLLPVISYPVLAQSKQTDQINQLTNALKSSKFQLDIVSKVPGVIPGAKALQQNRLNNIIAIARQRKDLLTKEIQTKPQDFLNQATLFKERDQYPKEVQEYLEQEIAKEGLLSILHFHTNNNSSGFIRLFETQDKIRYTLHFSKDVPKISGGSRVRIKGVVLAEDVALDSGTSGIQPLSAQTVTSPTLDVRGNQRMAVIMVNFQDDPRRIFTADQLRRFIFDYTKPSVNDYYKETSFDQLSWSGDIYGWYTVSRRMDDPCSVWSGLSWTLLANDAATNAGVNLSQYNRWVFVFPRCPQANWNGFEKSGPGGSVVGVQVDDLNLRILETFSHELAHSLGIKVHASGYWCNDREAIIDPARCQIKPNGDQYTLLGGIKQVSDDTANESFQLNALFKSMLGWIPMYEVTQSGVYNIYTSEKADSGQKILRIRKPDTNEYYYLEYRQPVGYDARLKTTITAGISIHFWNETLIGSAVADSAYDPKLLDIQHLSVPGSYFWGSSLNSSHPEFYDAANNIYIRQNFEASDNDKARVIVRLDGRPAVSGITCLDRNADGTCNLPVSASRLSANNKLAAVNTQTESGDSGMGGVTVRAVNTSTGGTVEDMSDSSGSFRLEVPAEGSYRIEVVDPEGYTVENDNQIVNVDFDSLDNPQVSIPLAVSLISATCTVSPNPVNAGQTAIWSVSNPTGGNGSYVYFWSGTDELSGSSQTAGKSYSTSDTKTASVRVTSGSQTVNINCPFLTVNVSTTPGCTTNISSITRNPPPAGSTIPTDSTVAAYIGLNNIANNAVTRTRWYMGDTAATINEITPTITYTSLSRSLTPVGFGYNKPLRTAVEHNGTTTTCNTITFNNPSPGASPPPQLTGSSGNFSNFRYHVDCSDNGHGNSQGYGYYNDTVYKIFTAWDWSGGAALNHYEAWVIPSTTNTNAWECYMGPSTSCSNNENVTGAGYLFPELDIYRDDRTTLINYAAKITANSSPQYATGQFIEFNMGSFYSARGIYKDPNWLSNGPLCPFDLVVGNSNVKIISPVNTNNIRVGDLLSFEVKIEEQGLGLNAPSANTRLSVFRQTSSGPVGILNNDKRTYNILHGSSINSQSQTLSWSNLTELTSVPGNYNFSICANSNYAAAGEFKHDNNCGEGTYTVFPACDPNQAGNNQFLGCLWNKGGNVNFDPNSTSFDYPVDSTPSIPAPFLSIPVADSFTAIDYGWGINAPAFSSKVSDDNFSIKWRGNFTFKKGTYAFTAGSDDGIKVKINGVEKLNKWYNRNYTQDTFTQTFNAPTTALVEIEYYEAVYNARVKFGWVYQPIISGYITRSGSGSVQNVTVRVLRLDGQYRDATTDSQGKFAVEGFVPGGSRYSVKVLNNLSSPQTAPAGLLPPARTSSSSYTWNNCTSRDTPAGSESYECQQAGSGVDCASSNIEGGVPPGRCSFTYTSLPDPVITPNFGPGRGGTNITISGSGTNFASGLIVFIGGIRAANVNVVNPTTITAQTPSHPRLLGDVNGSNSITALDALCTLRKAAELPVTTACPASGYSTASDVIVRNVNRTQTVSTGGFTYQHADVNGSGTITALDALCVLRMVAGLPVTTACLPPASAAALVALNAPKAPACNVSGSNIGDVDGNGKITEDDLKLIAGKIFNLPNSGLNTIQTRRADVNGDNRIDNTDAYLLADYLSNNNPATFPVCKTANVTPKPAATPTPAPVKPAIISVSVSDLSSSQAKASWTTNTAATSQVFYGTQLNKLDQSSALNQNLTTSHSVTLTKLTPNKVYYFKVKSTNNAGSIESTVKIFKTKP